MPCYHPIKGYRSRGLSVNGKFYFTTSPKEGYVDFPMSVPCGQCIGCRLERSRQWAIRCVHEAQQHEKNSFITLTFSDEYLNKYKTLNKKDFQLFMKRLRKHYKTKIRYFHCGEYGEKFQRPHHHACLFGLDFPDKTLWSVREGVRLYRSERLEKIWNQGYCTIGEVTFESAAYVARYVTKKITGSAAADHYKTIDKETGEVTMRIPEYNTMSRRPGIARAWIEKNHGDVYPDDYVLIRKNIKCKPPRYYDTVYDTITTTPDESKIKKIKTNRKIKANARKENSTPERLAVRETIKKNKLKKLLRSYENDI